MYDNVCAHKSQYKPITEYNGADNNDNFLSHLKNCIQFTLRPKIITKILKKWTYKTKTNWIISGCYTNRWECIFRWTPRKSIKFPPLNNNTNRLMICTKQQKEIFSYQLVYHSFTTKLLIMDHEREKNYQNIQITPSNQIHFHGLPCYSNSFPYKSICTWPIATKATRSHKKTWIHKLT